MGLQKFLNQPTLLSYSRTTYPGDRQFFKIFQTFSNFHIKFYRFVIFLLFFSKITLKEMRLSWWPKMIITFWKAQEISFHKIGIHFQLFQKFEVIVMSLDTFLYIFWDDLSFIFWLPFSLVFEILRYKGGSLLPKKCPLYLYYII